MNLIDIQGTRPLSNVLWNLFLACIPIAIAFALARRIHRDRAEKRPVRWTLVVLGLAVWAVFLPNTCYLLTEWRHYLRAVKLSENANHAARMMGQPIDAHQVVGQLLAMTGFYALYSTAGLIAFFLSVWPLDRLVRERFPRGAVAIRLGVFALCGLGVYLGLVHRYNTWDLIIPSRLPAIISTSVTATLHPFVLALVIGFALVLWLLYEAFDIFMDGWMLRRAIRREHVENSS